MTGPELRAIRSALGLSQSEMGEALALSGAYVGNRVAQWERGKRPIPAYVARIAELMAQPAVSRQSASAASAT